jgi:hypothetical protein
MRCEFLDVLGCQMQFHGVAKQIEKPFTFAVVGDTHFAHPKFYPDLGQETSHSRPLKPEKYIENVHHVLTPMMQALKKELPAFVVMTGDLVEGHTDTEFVCAEMKACLDFFGRFEIPILIARGNHDSTDAFDQIVRPFLAKGLGWTPEERYYFVDVAGCRLIMLDTTDWHSEGTQCMWLSGLLKQGEEIQINRTFVFGHHPIWPVARSRFTNPDFHNDMPRVLSEHSVDAYFCGHTHNQSIIHHRTEGLPVLQFMGAPIGLVDEIPVPLDRVARIVPRGEDLLSCWPGYLENTAPGWFKVEVGRQEVAAEWHHLIRGVETQTEWCKRGDLDRFDYMHPPSDARLIHTDLPSIRRAFLRFGALNSEAGGKCLLINGSEVGEMPPGTEYRPLRMELPTWCLSKLKMDNRIEIRVDDDDASTLGNLVLEAILPGGRIARTKPTGETYSWNMNPGNWGMGGPIKKLKQGRPVTTLLSFN